MYVCICFLKGETASQYKKWFSAEPLNEKQLLERSHFPLDRCGSSQKTKHKKTELYSKSTIPIEYSFKINSGSIKVMIVKNMILDVSGKKVPEVSSIVREGN